VDDPGGNELFRVGTVARLVQVSTASRRHVAGSCWRGSAAPGSDGSPRRTEALRASVEPLVARESEPDGARSDHVAALARSVAGCTPSTPGSTSASPTSSRKSCRPRATGSPRAPGGRDTSSCPRSRSRRSSSSRSGRAARHPSRDARARARDPAHRAQARPADPAPARQRGCRSTRRAWHPGGAPRARPGGSGRVDGAQRDDRATRSSRRTREARREGAGAAPQAEPGRTRGGRHPHAPRLDRLAALVGAVA
jgi:hypothetical protein